MGLTQIKNKWSWFKMPRLQEPALVDQLGPTGTILMVFWTYSFFDRLSIAMLEKKNMPIIQCYIFIMPYFPPLNVYISKVITLSYPFIAADYITEAKQISTCIQRLPARISKKAENNELGIFTLLYSPYSTKVHQISVSKGIKDNNIGKKKIKIDNLKILQNS